MIEEEEDEEEQDSSHQSPPPKQPTPKIVDPAKVKSNIKQAMEKGAETRFEGQQMVLRSIFDHSLVEAQKEVPAIQTDMLFEQEFMLTQEFSMMKIKPASQKAQEAKLT